MNRTMLLAQLAKAAAAYAQYIAADEGYPLDQAFTVCVKVRQIQDELDILGDYVCDEDDGVIYDSGML